MSDQTAAKTAIAEAVAEGKEIVHGKSGVPLGAIKKPKAKKATKPSTNGRARKEGLRKPQVRILSALAKSKKPLTRGEIKAKISENPDSPTAIGDALGIDDPTKRKAGEKKAGFPSLLTLGYVKRDVIGENGAADDRKETIFTISANGRKALERSGK